MKTNTNQMLLEKVTHKTNNAPYSLYHWEGNIEEEYSLYLHWHHEMEFFYLNQGTLLFHVEDQSFELHAGEGVFIPPESIHYASNIDTVTPIFHAFVLSPDFIVSPLDTNRYNTYILPILHNNLQYARKLTGNDSWQKDVLKHLEYIFSCETEDDLYIQAHTLFIWNLLYKNIIINSNLTAINIYKSEQLSSSLNYIHEHYKTNISLDALAELAHLSKGQFCRSFKELTGMSPFHYLIRYRILQSCNELLQTNRKITDIALTNGFNNVSYYNRAFLKFMGMTPKEYRKTCTSNHS